jgi:hypothetical protein
LNADGRMNSTLKSYFYWTYKRGSFHYDVMVTLILLFIFITPRLWDYGDKPTSAAGLSHPIQVVGDGERGVIVSLAASDVNIPEGATNNEVRRALRRAIEPITGDAVVVQRWETAKDNEGNLVWKIWAHR